MNREELIKKITEKKEFSQLPEKDVEMAYSHFEKRQTSEEEKIKLTRKLLREVFSSFVSKKILSPKNKDYQWILRKHLSTRERLPAYNEIYKRILKDTGKKVSIIDLGCGINGFSYQYFKDLGLNVNYLGIEAIGQLVDLTNDYFKRQNIQGKLFHLSLFEKEKIKDLIKKTKSPKITFLFKTMDSLEMLKRNYSLELIEEIAGISDRVCVSFATKSFVKREIFKAKRTWFTDFIQEKFKIIEDFETQGERYILFEK